MSDVEVDEDREANTSAMRELRSAYKDLRNQLRDRNAEVEELRGQLEQQKADGGAVRSLAVEHLATTRLGLPPARAKAAGRLHKGAVSEDALAETVARFKLDRPVGPVAGEGDDA